MTGDNDGRDDELNALADIEGIDTAKITEQLNKRKGIKTEAEPVKPTVTPTPETKPPEPIKPRNQLRTYQTQKQSCPAD